MTGAARSMAFPWMVQQLIEQMSRGAKPRKRGLLSKVGHTATGARLWLRVHADAFRLDPAAYLQAVAWRARGLRLRSRNRFAALAGHSPFAYPFWIACREPRLRDAFTGSAASAARILPLIDGCGGANRISRTLKSLDGFSTPVIVGGRRVEGAITIGNISEVADQMSAEEVWICPIAAGDTLAEGALAAYSASIGKAPAGTTLIYADDDLLDEKGARTAPHFKPDWNPDLFAHHDFLTGASIVKANRGQLRDLPAEGWQRRLVDEALAKGTPTHVSLVLHHRRNRPQPKVPDAPAKVEVHGWPPVTVIVPTRNRASLLRTCIEGLERTSYPRLQILVIDNESDEPDAVALFSELGERGVQVVPAPGPFNYSRLNNQAVAQATGDLLCFLNNDIEIGDPQWLSLLAVHAVRPDVGAVGARLLYPDGRIQHAGVFTGVGGGAAHGHRFERHERGGYFERSRLPQRVSAVTGACLVVERAKFLAVGGFDEENFAVAFNDVDLCLKLNERGWQAFYEPRATLVHHESVSRGSDSSKENRARFAGELAMLKRKWRTDERPDPFHHPHLSPFCEQFLIAV